jgi:hypothetical protein
MKAKEFIIELKKESKPRNFVAKNAKMGGAGQHKDKKKAAKQGDVKHKKQDVEEGWKDKVAAAGLAGAMAFGAGGAHARVSGDQDPGINRLTGKPIATQQATDTAPAKAEAPKGFSKEYLQSVVDGKHPRPMVSVEKAKELLKNMSESIVEGENLSIGQQMARDGITYSPEKENEIINMMIDYMKKDGYSSKQIRYYLSYDEDFIPDQLSYLPTKDMTERIRDPEDWDEGNTEPPNNFAVYINGKKWKVFQGRGQYADDQREKAHYQQLKTWAANKSATTGKKWEVSITGEAPTA